MPVVRVHVLYCASGTCACLILCQWCMYIFCIVPVVLVRVLYCCSVREHDFIVTAVRVHVLYCDSVRCH